MNFPFGAKIGVHGHGPCTQDGVWGALSICSILHGGFPSKLAVLSVRPSSELVYVCRHDAEYAQFLHDASELQFTERAVDHFSEGTTKAEDLLVIRLPVLKPQVLVPVIELYLKD